MPLSTYVRFNQLSPSLSKKVSRKGAKRDRSSYTNIHTQKKPKQNKKKSPGLFNQKTLLFGGLGQLLATAKQLSEEETLLAV